MPSCTRRSRNRRSSASTTSGQAAQNIPGVRFANGLFRPSGTENFIDHIQIDIPEKLGLDQRAFYESTTGAYKDMVVTHLFR